MLVDVSTVLPCAPEQAIRQVSTSRLHRHVSAPLLRFVPKEPSQLPEVWSEGTYWVSMYLFGFVPFGAQAMVVSFPECREAFCVRDNGHGSYMRKWDHWVMIKPEGEGTLYRDRVTIEAGILTPLVWGFAQIFYRHRQRRWRKLAARSFEYQDA
jgi:hypothetical protein